MGGRHLPNLTPESKETLDYEKSVSQRLQNSVEPALIIETKLIGEAKPIMSFQFQHSYGATPVKGGSQQQTAGENPFCSPAKTQQVLSFLASTPSQQGFSSPSFSGPPPTVEQAIKLKELDNQGIRLDGLRKAASAA